eukprot:Rhum_TRINITY_DN15001_c1_g1::Rhum_TRINITY_DN15001_c1_g1_i1::g.133210::m.133210
MHAVSDVAPHRHLRRQVHTTPQDAVASLRRRLRVRRKVHAGAGPTGPGRRPHRLPLQEPGGVCARPHLGRVDVERTGHPHVVLAAEVAAALGRRLRVQQTRVVRGTPLWHVQRVRRRDDAGERVKHGVELVSHRHVGEFFGRAQRPADCLQLREPLRRRHRRSVPDVLVRGLRHPPHLLHRLLRRPLLQQLARQRRLHLLRAVACVDEPQPPVRRRAHQHRATPLLCVHLPARQQRVHHQQLLRMHAARQPHQRLRHLLARRVLLHERHRRRLHGPRPPRARRGVHRHGPRQHDVVAAAAAAHARRSRHASRRHRREQLLQLLRQQRADLRLVARLRSHPEVPEPQLRAGGRAVVVVVVDGSLARRRRRRAAAGPLHHGVRAARAAAHGPQPADAHNRVRAACPLTVDGLGRRSRPRRQRRPDAAGHGGGVGEGGSVAQAAQPLVQIGALQVPQVGVEVRGGIGRLVAMRARRAVELDEVLRQTQDLLVLLVHDEHAAPRGVHVASAQQHLADEHERAVAAVPDGHVGERAEVLTRAVRLPAAPLDVEPVAENREDVHLRRAVEALLHNGRPARSLPRGAETLLQIGVVQLPRVQHLRAVVLAAVAVQALPPLAQVCEAPPQKRLFDGAHQPDARALETPPRADVHLRLLLLLLVALALALALALA